MAAVEGEADRGLDVEDILSRTERRPLTFSRRRVLYQAPEFVKRLNGDDNANEGATVHFECKVKGFPKPALTWYKDDQQMELNSRFKVESLEGGIHIVTIDNVKRSDEATYRCRAENVEGITSSTFYLSVKGKSSSRSSKRKKSQSPNRRLVSFPLLFPTIVEKVDEEEKEEEVAKKQPPSPLTQLYDGTTMQTRHTWPKFVGDWAFVEDGDERFCAASVTFLSLKRHVTVPWRSSKVSSCSKPDHHSLSGLIDTSNRIRLPWRLAP